MARWTEQTDDQERFDWERFLKDLEEVDGDIEKIDWSMYPFDLDDVDDEDSDYFVNYEPWIYYGTIEDLQTIADNEKNRDMSDILVW